MEWTQFVIFCVGVGGLFVWNRTESRADARHMDAKLESNRSLSLQVHQENLQVLSAIKDEIKDFHGRLCAIEEAKKYAK